MIILIFVFTFFGGQCSENINLSKSLNFFVVILSLGSFICSILGCYPTLQSKHHIKDYSQMYENAPKGTAFPFCYNYYVDAMLDVIDYTRENGKTEEYFYWVVEIMDKILEKNLLEISRDNISEAIKYYSIAIDMGPADETRDLFLIALKSYEGLAGNGYYNNKLCRPTGVPILAFAILTIIGLFLFMVALCINIRCNESADKANNSIEQNDTQP
ncbi:hypothetical protein M9Y10_017447 [Tritrichomonas musculus]|uniref:Uncharacterized protein n=1 Tax=Tritrichomonas musculus TaxID=1915356 RepID=A0ABR2HTM9_9EUKA